MFLKSRLNRLRNQLGRPTERLIVLEARRAAWEVSRLPVTTQLRKAGFGAFSQFDEDGIIQFLISHLEIKNQTFIEFGVENYEESNTRFLLINDNWQGMVMDGSEESVAYIKSDRVSRRYDLQAKCSFITRENINDLLRQSGFDEYLGLLSIDIDGNDYWVWEAIDSVRPRIVISEYNSVFGREPVSIPYQADFYRTKAHHSNLYYGCSLSALTHLAKRKGYVLAGSNQRGNNAFFVRKDIAGSLPERSADDEYVSSHFRESRHADGKNSYLREAARRKAISHLPIVNVVTGQTSTLGE